MSTRADLQAFLESLDPSVNVYYQPPESVKICYPAIIYSLNDIDNAFADDIVYKQERSYQLMVIDEDPDSLIVELVSIIPRVKWNRRYVTENLYHNIFTLYF